MATGLFPFNCTVHTTKIFDLLAAQFAARQKLVNDAKSFSAQDLQALDTAFPSQNITTMLRASLNSSESSTSSSSTTAASSSDATSVSDSSASIDLPSTMAKLHLPAGFHTPESDAFVAATLSSVDAPLLQHASRIISRARAIATTSPHQCQLLVSGDLLSRTALYLEDVAFMASGEWLRVNALDAFLHRTAQQPPDFISLPTGFFRDMSDGRPESITAATNFTESSWPSELFPDFCVQPIHLAVHISGSSHFISVFLLPRLSGIWIIDPLWRKAYDEVVAIVTRWYSAELARRAPAAVAPRWVVKYAQHFEHVPLQDDSRSCGVFAAMIPFFFFSNQPRFRLPQLHSHFGQYHADQLRQFISFHAITASFPINSTVDQMRQHLSFIEQRLAEAAVADEGPHSTASQPSSSSDSSLPSSSTATSSFTTSPPSFQSGSSSSPVSVSASTQPPEATAPLPSSSHSSSLPLPSPFSSPASSSSPSTSPILTLPHGDQMDVETSPSSSSPSSSSAPSAAQFLRQKLSDTIASHLFDALVEPLCNNYSLTMAQLMVNCTSTMPIGSYCAASVDSSLTQLKAVLGDSYTGRISAELSPSSSSSPHQNAQIVVSSFVIHAPDGNKIALSQQEFESLLIMREIQQTRHLFRPHTKPGQSRKRQSTLLNCPLNAAQAAAAAKAKNLKVQSRKDKQQVKQLLQHPDYVPRSIKVLFSVLQFRLIACSHPSNFGMFIQEVEACTVARLTSILKQHRQEPARRSKKSDLIHQVCELLHLEHSTEPPASTQPQPSNPRKRKTTCDSDSEDDNSDASDSDEDDRELEDEVGYDGEGEVEDDDDQGEVEEVDECGDDDDEVVEEEEDEEDSDANELAARNVVFSEDMLAEIEEEERQAARQHAIITEELRQNYRRSSRQSKPNSRLRDLQ